MSEKSQSTSPSCSMVTGDPNQSRVSRTRSPVGAVGVGPRRIETQNARLGSNEPLAPARAVAYCVECWLNVLQVVRNIWFWVLVNSSESCFQ